MYARYMAYHFFMHQRMASFMSFRERWLDESDADMPAEHLTDGDIVRHTYERDRRLPVWLLSHYCVLYRVPCAVISSYSAAFE